jgi:hypothetical protein
MEELSNNIFQIGQRKTFLTGTFYGKFRTVDKTGHVLTPFESLNKIEIYESQVLHLTIQSEERGAFNIPPEIKQFNLGLENPIQVYFEKADGKGNFYNINLLEPVFTDIKLDEIVTEGKNSFGKIDGIIYGYILDEVKHPFSGKLEEVVEETRVLERRQFTSHTGEKYWGDWYVSKELPIEISLPPVKQSWHGGILSWPFPQKNNSTAPEKRKSNLNGWLLTLLVVALLAGLFLIIVWQPKFAFIMILVALVIFRLIK